MTEPNDAAMNKAIKADMARLRDRLGSGEVAAMLEREIHSGADCRRWRFFVTDGERAIRVEAELSGTQAAIFGRQVEHPLLEAAVERRALTDCAIDCRMEDLAEADPIQLRAEDLRPPPEPSALTQ
jgi:hypothetical protein